METKVPQPAHRYDPLTHRYPRTVREAYPTADDWLTAATIRPRRPVGPWVVAACALGLLALLAFAR